MMLAQQVSPEFLGNWVGAGLLIIGGIVGLFSIITFFATKEQVREIKERQAILEQDVKDNTKETNRVKDELIANGEKRSTSLHRRLDPLIENTAALKAGGEAWTEAFRGFVETQKATLSALTKEQR